MGKQPRIIVTGPAFSPPAGALLFPVISPRAGAPLSPGYTVFPDPWPPEISPRGLAARVPARRPELLLRPLGDDGRHVVKDPRTGDYYTLGKQESFLLAQLDGEQAAEAVCQAFAERFGEALSQEDLDEFVRLARAKGFLLSDGQ